MTGSVAWNVFGVTVAVGSMLSVLRWGSMRLARISKGGQKPKQFPQCAQLHVSRRSSRSPQALPPPPPLPENVGIHRLQEVLEKHCSDTQFVLRAQRVGVNSVATLVRLLDRSPLERIDFHENVLRDAGLQVLAVVQGRG